MAKEEFSWLTENTLESLPSQPPEKLNLLAFDEFRRRILAHKASLLLVGSLILCLIILKIFRQDSPAPARKLESMAAVMPIAKGQVIEGMLIRPILIGPSTLSKSQNMQRLLPNDAEKVMGKVRAKKDIPPHRPLLWGDLELIPAQRKWQKSPAPLVVYPEDSP